MEPALSSGSAHVGRVLAGKYRLDERLRAGAMGAIYRAQHLTLDKTICIKVMHPHLAKDPLFAARFHREARAASRFDHPGSILILDYGADEDGTLFIAMELVDGRDLLDIIEDAQKAPGGVRKAFPVKRIVDLMSQLLAALAAAHDVGILHRDLKPENVMVANAWDDGLTERVKVCDFGIALMEDDSKDAGPKLTVKGRLLGTPEYMSPEQAKGETLDGRTDLYSAGIILYQLLTGHVPFSDPSPLKTAMAQINDQPKPPSEIVPAVSRELEAICLRALKKNPADRFASAREMRAALRDVIGAPASSPTPLAALVGSSKDTVPLPLTTPRPTPPSKRNVTPAAMAATMAEPLASGPTIPVPPMARPEIIHVPIAVAPSAIATPRPSAPSIIAAPRPTMSPRAAQTSAIAALGIALLLAGGAGFFLTRSNHAMAPNASVLATSPLAQKRVIGAAAAMQPAVTASEGAPAPDEPNP